jgi:predicted  nucleic acid-binding Zn-ribbon protein
MTIERRKLRAKIEEVRLNIDRIEADLKKATTNRARDSLRKRRLEAGEELARLWTQLEKLPPR